MDERFERDRTVVKALVLRADPVDAGEILALQKLAYRSEADLYGDDRILPLTQTRGEIEGEFSHHVFLKVVAGDRIVGSVRAAATGDTCHIGRLIVHPSCQGRGLGKRLMAGIENCFSGVKRYELFTGSKSEKNLAFYQKLGYRPFREEKVSASLTFVYLEKWADPTTRGR